MNKEKLILITHFINPYQFWYYESPNEKAEEIDQTEKKLHAVHASRNMVKNIRPCLGQKIAVYFVSWNKYIRCEVKSLVKDDGLNAEYIVWAIDHGFPFITNASNIVDLPKKFSMPSDRVRYGGIGEILPAEKELDYSTGLWEVMKQSFWNQRACDMLEEVLNDSAIVSFIPHSECPFNTNDQIWGDLKIINHQNKTIFASQFLIDVKFAVKASSDFRKICHTLEAAKCCIWLLKDGRKKYKENKLPPSQLMRTTVQEERFDMNDDTAQRRIDDWCDRNKRCTSTTGSIRSASTDLPFGEYDDCDDSVSMHKNIAVNEDPNADIQYLHMAAMKIRYGKIPIMPNKEAFNCFPLITLSESQEKCRQIEVRSKKLLELKKKIDNCDFVCEGNAGHPSIQQKKKIIEGIDAQSLVSDRASSSCDTVKSSSVTRKLHNLKFSDLNEKIAAFSSDYQNADLATGQVYHENSELTSKKSTEEQLTADFLDKINTLYGIKVDQQQSTSQKKLAKKEQSRSYEETPSSVGSALNKSELCEKIKKRVLIPAGYDLMNLVDYKDEENHWHRKKTTFGSTMAQSQFD